MPRKFLRRINAESYQIASLQAELAVKGKSVEIHEAIMVDLTIRTFAGPVEVRQVEVCIIDDDMDEILIGNCLLKRLGINVDAEMEKLAGQAFNMSDEQKAIDKAMPEFVPIGKLDEKEVQKVLEAQLKKCLDNGATPDQVREEIVFRYPASLCATTCGAILT